MTGQTKPNAAAKPDPKAMANSLNTMDSMTQEICARISTLAALAERNLKSLKLGKSEVHHVLGALGMIAYWAGDLENLINCEAESHGCNYIAQDREDE